MFRSSPVYKRKENPYRDPHFKTQYIIEIQIIKIFDDLTKGFTNMVKYNGRLLILLRLKRCRNCCDDLKN